MDTLDQAVQKFLGRKSTDSLVELKEEYEEYVVRLGKYKVNYEIECELEDYTGRIEDIKNEISRRKIGIIETKEYRVNVEEGL